MNDKLKVLGISGSLRKGSYNTSLLRETAALLQEDAVVEMADISVLPLFNQDLENAMPPEAVLFKQQVEAADAILFVTPEYNYSVPGVLKNATDWASRPYGKNSFDGKPAGVIGASTGMLGTSRAQYHLRQMFVTLNMFALNKPEIMVTLAAKKFDEQGNLTDEDTKKRLTVFTAAFIAWIKRMKNNQ